MARRKRQPSSRKRKRKQKRTDAEYVASAKNLASLVPSLRPLAKRKRLKPSEKSRITRREKQLKGIPDIFPVTARQANHLKGQVLFKGVQGIQLRNVPVGSKIRFKKKEITIEEPNGRKWLYWHLSRATVRSKRGMKAAGKAAFRQQFPIEIVAELAAIAFKTKEVVQVQLWAHAGVVGRAHETLAEFIEWVNGRWSAGRYIADSKYSTESDPGKWVNGIAILLEDPEYTRKREEDIAKNKNVLRDLEATGKRTRAKERRRLTKKGLLDTLGTPLPKKTKKAKKKRKWKIKLIKRRSKTQAFITIKLPKKGKRK